MIEDFDPKNPPRGAWFDEGETAWQVGATTRSPFAWVMLPFAFIWTCSSLALFTAQFKIKEFHLVASLVGIPIFLITVLLVMKAITCVCGKETISVAGSAGCGFFGVGPIGWKTRFDWRDVDSVEEVPLRTRSGGYGISLVGREFELTVGTMVTDARRRFMLHALRHMRNRTPTRPDAG